MDDVINGFTLLKIINYIWIIPITFFLDLSCGYNQLYNYV